jgi:NDP-sugar pyrophosphorylase family protein
MQAILLAAGFGTRMGQPTPKAFLSVGQYLALDLAVGSLSIPQITNILIVHNSKWAGRFREWIRKSPSKYIKLLSDGARINEKRRGAVGSLEVALEKIGDRDFILTEVDTLFSYDLQDFLIEAGLSITLALYSFREYDNLSLYGKVDVDERGRILNFYEKSDVVTDCCWLGPAWFPSGTKPLVNEYCERKRKEGRIPDNLGSLVVFLRGEGLQIRGWHPRRGRAYDISQPLHRELAKEAFS